MKIIKSKRQIDYDSKISEAEITSQYMKKINFKILLKKNNSQFFVFNVKLNVVGCTYFLSSRSCAITTRLKIFPLAVLGIASVKTTPPRNFLCGATLVATYS
jgi:hypothetical protein